MTGVQTCALPIWGEAPVLADVSLGRAAIDALPMVRERVMDTEDAREGIQSFIERRKAVFKGR